MSARSDPAATRSQCGVTQRLARGIGTKAGAFSGLQLVSVPSRHFVEGGLFADPSTDGTAVNVSIELSQPKSLAQPAESARATRVSLLLVDRDTNLVVAETTT